MEEENTSSDYRTWFDEFLQSISDSTAVSCKTAGSSSAEEPIQDVQLEEVIQYLEQQQPKDISQLSFSHDVQAETSDEMVHVSDTQHVLDNQPVSYVSIPQTVHMQPRTDIPQPVVENGGTPGDIPYSAYAQQVVNYDDVQPSATNDTGQTDNQWHTEAATEVPIVTFCKSEYNVSQSHVEPTVSEYQNSPLPSASAPRKVGKLKKQRVIKIPDEHACLYCDQKFKFKYLMMEHFRAVHMVEKPYECNYEGCVSKFGRKVDLMRHIKIHTKERPYGCPFCEQCFARKDSMDAHKLTHSSRILEFPEP